MTLKALVIIEIPGHEKQKYFATNNQPIPKTNVNNHGLVRVRLADKHIELSASYGGMPYPALSGTHTFRIRENSREVFYSDNWLLHELRIRPCTKVTIKAVSKMATL